MSGQIIEGKYISIHLPNIFFNNVAAMLLEHFDVPARSDNLFLLSSFVRTPVLEFKKKFPNKKIISYQLEQMLGGNSFHNSETAANNLIGSDEIWDYDFRNVVWLEWKGIKVDKIVPMLYCQSLEWKSKFNANPLFDVVFLGSPNLRRAKIIEKIFHQNYGKLKFAIIFGDSEMESHVRNSKVSLNLHAFEPWNRQEQVRMFVPIINGHSVISEPSQVNEMRELIIENSLDNLGYFLLNFTKGDDWIKFGLEAKEKFKEKTRLWKIKDEID